jgi:hypothetical protein
MVILDCQHTKQIKLKIFKPIFHYWYIFKGYISMIQNPKPKFVKKRAPHKKREVSIKMYEKCYTNVVFLAPYNLES